MTQKMIRLLKLALSFHNLKICDLFLYLNRLKITWQYSLWMLPLGPRPSTVHKQLIIQNNPLLKQDCKLLSFVVLLKLESSSSSHDEGTYNLTAIIGLYDQTDRL